MKETKTQDLSADTAQVSQRGVVFDLQKQLVQRLGELTGKPVTSGLHIHPLHNYACDEKDADPNLNLISTDQSQKLPENIANNYHTRKQSTLLGWHSDISYEAFPSDYVALKLTQLPRTGGGECLHSIRRVFFVPDFPRLPCRYPMGLVM